MQYKNILITGAAGFIGADFAKLLIKEKKVNIYLVDSLTYASNKSIWYSFDTKILKYEVSINDHKIENIVSKNNIDCIVNFAAETHVDNSIINPKIFFETNVLGVINLIEIARKLKIRFHQVSTDEVYGALELNSTNRFEIDTPLNPSSPYSSSKASADLAIISYGKTYNLDYTISRCGNNYGPTQHKEKLIPHSVDLLLNKNKIEIYGDGENVRDWIYVRDHNLAILKILNVISHETRIYNIGSENELNNLEISNIICQILGVNYEESINFVKDRKSHDRRYALNPRSINSIKWSPQTSFAEGMKNTMNKILDKFLKSNGYNK